MKNFYFSIFIILLWGCQFEALDEGLPESTNLEQENSIYKVQAVDKTVLQDLGLKMKKRIGFDLIQTEQMRTDSDFIFDFESSLLTSDTLKRKTYTVPFLEIGDLYSTFNLVIVSDSSDNLLSQYVLQYELDSSQYHDFQATQNLLSSGVTIKRFPISSFFNDSNPMFLERCTEIYDENGDPITCDEVTIDSASSGSGGGSGSSGDAWITPGGSSTGGDGSSSGSSGSSGGGSGTPCTWTVTYIYQENIGGSYCEPATCVQTVVTISCGDDPYLRKNSTKDYGMMQCMDCEISDFDFGTPAFTPTKAANAINRDLGKVLLDSRLEYLSITNPTFANKLWLMLNDEANIDQGAALFTIEASFHGAFYGNFNSNFGAAIEGLMYNSDADFTNDIILRLLQTYFEINYAILKQQNPNWTDEKLFYEASKEVIHLSLDAVGLIEGLGTPADLLNAGFYFLEGDRLNGTISLVAATPGVGLIATTSKGVLKLGGLIPGTSKRMSYIWKKVDENIIEFSGTTLRKVINLTDAAYEAHHLIPYQLRTHEVVQLAARAEIPFHINQFENGYKLLKKLNGNHTNYNNRMIEILDIWKSSRRNPSSEDAKKFLEELMDEIRDVIDNNPNVGMQDLEF